MERERGWRTRLPPRWPGFDTRTWRHMWVEFVVGSPPNSEGFSPGPQVFPRPSGFSLGLQFFLPPQNQHIKFPIRLETVDKRATSRNAYRLFPINFTLDERHYFQLFYKARDWSRWKSQDEYQASCLLRCGCVGVCLEAAVNQVVP